MTIAVPPPVPADIRPAEVELATIAILMRAGIFRGDVPVYSDASLIRELTRIARDLTLPTARRKA